MTNKTSEKSEPLLPSNVPVAVAPKSSWSFKHRTGIFLLFCCAAVVASKHIRCGGHKDHKGHSHHGNHSEDLCPQPDVLAPSSELATTLEQVIGTPEFQTRAVEWLGGAVRVPTESYDHMGPVGEDERWNVFGPFHEYLLKAYPLIHKNLKLSKVNTHGLIFEWTGSDTSLKPILFAGHQDVVPVDMTTVDQWTHPPYSGYFDGERVWGRGSADDKSGLIGVMSSIEQLLEHDFKPTRTVVLAFGFDEEASGGQGAGYLAPELLTRYGKDAFSMIIDEGSGFGESDGGIFATLGIAEKGYLDTKVEVTAAGGHSSLPPPHTSIGILAALLVAVEADKTPTHLVRGTPVYGTLLCLAAHAPKLDHKLRRAIKHSVKSDRALKAAEKLAFKDRNLMSMVGTTHAIDLIQGGVKVNALPERTFAVVNHRIATQSSVSDVKAHDTKLLSSLASKYNLTYIAFGSEISESGAPSAGTLTLSDAWENALEPAPITPTGDTPAFQVLAGTIRATYNAHRGGNVKPEDEIKISPGIMSGNTDTRYYWALSKHIYRYNHHNTGGDLALLGGIHTVNESMNIYAFVEMIRFFSTLILNADESRMI